MSGPISSLIIAMLLAGTSAFAQSTNAPSIEWEASYGGSGQDIATTIQVRSYGLMQTGTNCGTGLTEGPTRTDFTVFRKRPMAGLF
jgi:hypothetical protein